MNNRIEKPIIIKDLQEFIIRVKEKQIELDKNIILDLSDQDEVTSDDLKELARWLPQVPQVSICGLEDLKLDSKSIKYLAKALENCPNKSKIIIESLDFSDNEIRYSWAEYLAKILPHTRENFYLNLSKNQVGNLGLYYLARNLKQAPPGFKLNLASNKLDFFSDYSGIKYLAQALKDAPIGFHLDLRDNDIKQDGAQEIAEHIRFAPLDFHINLTNNKIRDRGAIAIAENIRFAPPGCKIDIGYNKISNEGAMALANNLQYAPLGFQLKLDFNHLIDKGVIQKFIDNLHQATQVINLTFSFNNYDECDRKQRAQLNSLLEKNQIKYAARKNLTFLKGEFAQELPTEILDEIFSYTFPLPNEEKQNKHFVKNVLNFFSQSLKRKAITDSSQHPLKFARR